MFEYIQFGTGDKNAELLSPSLPDVWKTIRARLKTQLLYVYRISTGASNLDREHYTTLVSVKVCTFPDATLDSRAKRWCHGWCYLLLLRLGCAQAWAKCRVGTQGRQRRARLVLVILPRSVPSTLAQCVAIYDCCSTHRRNGGLLTTAIMDPSSCGWHGIALGRIA